MQRRWAYDESGTGPVWWVKAVGWNVLVWGPVSLLLILLGTHC
jgi:hypothetical protein